MRIRKRFPPSSLSSETLSDPQLNRSLVVQPQVRAHLHGNLYVQEEVKTNCSHSDPQNQPPQQPTDEETMIGSEKPRWACPRNCTEEKMKQKEIEGKEIKDEEWKKKEEERSRSNDIRKESILSAEMDTQFSESSSSSHQVDRWCAGKKVVPLKKRKRSFERISAGEEITIKAKMKSKTNKKCMKQNGDGQDEGKKETNKEGFDSKNSTSRGAKKNKRGSVIMEGSRCSRVNGRGWRCCQQTLVGYSLCEHHLGKGRLRSMTSFRNRAMESHINAEEKHDQTARLSNLQDEKEITSLSSNNNDIDDDYDDERKPLMVTKKRMKLGAVKARSLSSLLSQEEKAANSNQNANRG